MLKSSGENANVQITGGFQYGDAMTNVQSSFVLATLIDGNPNTGANDLHASVNWGDGYTTTAGIGPQDGEFIITGGHSYPQDVHFVGPKYYTMTVTVTDVDGASATTTDTIVVGSLQVGSPATMSNWWFQDQNSYANTNDFVANGQTGMAVINWGDGTTSLGAISSGGPGGGAPTFQITAAHGYTQDSMDQPKGVYTITVTVTDDDGYTLTGQQYVSVVRPLVTEYAGNLETTPPNSLTFSGWVAAFTLPEAVDGSSEFSATINWGDNSSLDGGTVQEISPGLFEVWGGPHKYAVAGVYTVEVDVYQGWQNQQRIAVSIVYLAAGTIPIIGPTTVPGNSIYSYFVPIQGNMVGAPNPWTISTNPIVSGNAVPQVIRTGTTRMTINGKSTRVEFANIEFSNAIALVATISVKELVQSNVIQIFITKVNVVRVVVSTGSANKNTAMNPRARGETYGRAIFRISQPPTITYVFRNYYGNDVSAFKFTGHTLERESGFQFGSGLDANPAYQSNAPFAVVLPPNTNPDIIGDIQVGLIQTVRDTGFALYPFKLIRQMYTCGEPSWDAGQTHPKPRELFR